MEIVYHIYDKLVIEDDTRRLTFLDLAKIGGYKLEGNPNHHWVLYQCQELIKEKKIEFGLGTTYHCPSGKLSRIYFGYFLNHINRRTVELNEDGTVKNDFIMILDPRNSNSSYGYNATVPQAIQFEDYLSEDKKYYDNYDKSERIRNSILDDKYIQEYLYHSKFYCKLLNYYSDDDKMLKKIVQNFDDVFHLDGLIMIAESKTTNETNEKGSSKVKRIVRTRKPNNNKQD